MCRENRGFYSCLGFLDWIRQKEECSYKYFFYKGPFLHGTCNVMRPNTANHLVGLVWFLVMVLYNVYLLSASMSTYTPHTCLVPTEFYKTSFLFCSYVCVHLRDGVYMWVLVPAEARFPKSQNYWRLWTAQPGFWEPSIGLQQEWPMLLTGKNMLWELVVIGFLLLFFVFVFLAFWLNFFFCMWMFGIIGNKAGIDLWRFISPVWL